MKNFYNTLLLVMLMSIASKSAFAYDIVVRNDDGEAIYNIYYNFFYSNEGKELEVTYKSYSSDYGEARGYEKITIINIPETVSINGRKRKVTSIGSHAFDDCRNLKSVTIPNSVTIIGNSAFADCTRLTSVNIPNSVTSIGGWAFHYCI